MNRLATSLPCLFAAASLVMMAPMPSMAQTATQTGSAETMAEHAHAPAPLSTSLTLTIDGTATKLSVADLQAMPQTTVNVHNEHTKQDETYSGAPLADLLANGLLADQAHHHTMLHSYIVVEGTDKYWVVYSVAEIEPSAHNAEVIIATSIGGKPLGEDGQLKLIDTADKKPQRWVRNLTAITVKSAD